MISWPMTAGSAMGATLTKTRVVYASGKTWTRIFAGFVWEECACKRARSHGSRRLTPPAQRVIVFYQVCFGPDVCYCDERVGFPRFGFSFFLEGLKIFNDMALQDENIPPIIGNTRVYVPAVLDIPPGERLNFELNIARFNVCSGNAVPPFTAASPSNTGCLSGNVVDGFNTFDDELPVFPFKARFDVQITEHPAMPNEPSALLISIIVVPLTDTEVLSLPQNITFHVAFEVVDLRGSEPVLKETGNARSTRSTVTCAEGVPFDPEILFCGTPVGGLYQTSLLVPLLIGSIICCCVLVCLFWALDKREASDKSSFQMDIVGVEGRLQPTTRTSRGRNSVRRRRREGTRFSRRIATKSKRRRSDDDIEERLFGR